jgi:hypothetical protein
VLIKDFIPYHRRNEKDFGEIQSQILIFNISFSGGSLGIIMRETSS